MRKVIMKNSDNGLSSTSEIIEKIMNIIVKTKNNKEFIKVFLENVKKK
jgi:hypothetical protein